MTYLTDAPKKNSSTSNLIKSRAEYIWLSFLLILAFLLLPIIRLIKTERTMIEEKGHKEQLDKGLHYYNSEDVQISF